MSKSLDYHAELQMQIRLLESFEHEAKEESGTLETHGEEYNHIIEINENTIYPNSDTSGFKLQVRSNEILNRQDSDDMPSLDGIDCPEGKEPVFLYVKNVLIAYGIFTEDNASYWHAPSPPLANSIFEMMENKHLMLTEENGSMGLLHSMRRLLFDIVAELLVEIVGGPDEYVNLHTWSVKSMKSRKEIVQYMWRGVCELLMQSEYQASQETLEKFVANDLLHSHKDQWQGSNNVGIVVMEIERAIFNDMMHEMVSSL